MARRRHEMTPAASTKIGHQNPIPAARPKRDSSTSQRAEADIVAATQNKRVLRRLSAVGRRPLQVEAFSCSTVEEVEPQLLGLTYWFDVAEVGHNYPVEIRFTGHRLDAKGKMTASDRFTITESIEAVPGSGPIALTIRIRDLTPGDWQVNAVPVENRQKSSKRHSEHGNRPSLPRGSATGSTVYSPIVQVRAPGAHLGAWPLLVGLGFLVALATQALVARHLHLDVTRVMLLTLVAALVGLAGAKIYFLTGRAVAGRSIAGRVVPGQRYTRNGPSVGGMCIQGFVLGAVAVLIVGSRIAGQRPGVMLDVTAAGLLLGITIGRFGCFFGGCCAGRPTSSKWGIWSSNRRIGVRRIPTQLLESLLALSLGLIALSAMWFTTPRPPGVVFVGVIAAYTLGRQFLVNLRDQPRHTMHGRNRMLVITLLIIGADIAVGVSS
jgi:phosphatidylglycerol:prolipoprotein diacylglycerol transferase